MQEVPLEKILTSPLAEMEKDDFFFISHPIRYMRKLKHFSPRTFSKVNRKMNFDICTYVMKYMNFVC